MKKNRFSNAYRLGVLGGGQLGRMFILEAINYNLAVHIMDADPGAPSAEICSTFTIGDLRDYDQVVAFGKDKDTVTVELENVNVQALYTLEEKGVLVFPQPRVLEIIQDKGLQKQFYIDRGIPTSPFELLTESPNLEELKHKIPFVTKLRTGGYDGRGVQIIRKEEDLNTLFDAPSILEEIVPFVKELSVIVARNAQGQTAVFPTVECEFNEANLVAYLFSPAEITEDLKTKAQNVAIDVINALDMIGILAVELFLTASGEILVNEIAPRPHNSGHHTIECNVTSQFEQHLRAVLNLPLGSTEMVSAGAMLNLLGSEGHEGPAYYQGIETAMAHPGVHVHLYGKERTKANRKMGHITVTGRNIQEVRNTVSQIKDTVQVISDTSDY
ncbi:MAG: 5-(carboxyamino)imidazole ribonucleotide synthase [Bacteroidetes bacterium RIFCSPHIGHO2_02_FULL_44_7]|nr:MAG: 5-(carboxyamino)imidazole ribonucleotide synthase [Bacteroidetes bacterium RIFCSPHIGHO2_02_FULL_44_7]